MIKNLSFRFKDIIKMNFTTVRAVYNPKCIIKCNSKYSEDYKTYKCKSTKDFSGTFLLLRIIGNTIWTEYAIEVNSFLMLLNKLVCASIK